MRKVVCIVTVTSPALTSAIGGGDLASVADEAVEGNEEPRTVERLELLFADPQPAVACLAEEVACLKGPLLSEGERLREGRECPLGRFSASERSVWSWPNA